MGESQTVLRCRNCGQPIHSETFSDGSEEWQHDAPEDDWDGRICLITPTDNSWAQPA